MSASCMNKLTARPTCLKCKVAYIVCIARVYFVYFQFFHVFLSTIIIMVNKDFQFGGLLKKKTVRSREIRRQNCTKIEKIETCRRWRNVFPNTKHV